jgi:hypothetical protein
MSLPRFSLKHDAPYVLPESVDLRHDQIAAGAAYVGSNEVPEVVLGTRVLIVKSVRLSGEGSDLFVS